MAIWSEEAEDQLILLIQERPPLYDITEKRYANRVAKTQLWREIENTLSISEKELKKRRQESTSNLIKEPGAPDVDGSSDTGTSSSQEHSTTPEGTITPLEEPSFLQGTDCTPLAESTICGENNQSQHSSTRGKRSRKTLDESADDASIVLMRTLKTLETIASKHTGDGIKNYCRSLETRMRTLSTSRLPYVMNDIDNCLFKHVIDDQNQAHYTQLGE
ncbi:hypothetical protein UPYG_G00288470 [Umbra pygmaea]|uniref:MADF domain-containing protein n=1 Tax=Umbra pygmaea TaxID=75934 RepID=A0ABD0W4D0_UMBPY